MCGRFDAGRTGFPVDGGIYGFVVTETNVGGCPDLRTHIIRWFCSSSDVNGYRLWLRLLILIVIVVCWFFCDLMQLSLSGCCQWWWWVQQPEVELWWRRYMHAQGWFGPRHGIGETIRFVRLGRNDVKVLILWRESIEALHWGSHFDIQVGTFTKLYARHPVCIKVNGWLHDGGWCYIILE